jgi:hypothetical protein
MMMQVVYIGPSGHPVRSTGVHFFTAAGLDRDGVLLQRQNKMSE